MSSTGKHWTWSYLPAETQKMIVADYQSMTMKQLAARYGVSRSTIRRYLLLQGAAIKPRGAGKNRGFRKLSADVRAAVASESQSAGIRDLAHKYRVSVSTVRRYLLEQGG